MPVGTVRTAVPSVPNGSDPYRKSTVRTVPFTRRYGSEPPRHGTVKMVRFQIENRARQGRFFGRVLGTERVGPAVPIAESALYCRPHSRYAVTN